MNATQKTARVKQVFTSHELPHVWAKQTNKRGRVAAGNFYFEKNTIFSYGSHFPIATIVPGLDLRPIVLFTTRGYSNTTSKQIYAVRGAVSHMDKIYCYWPDVTKDTPEKHLENLQQFVKTINRNISELKKSQRSYSKVTKELQEIANTQKYLSKYISLFDLLSNTYVKKHVWLDSQKEEWKEVKKAVKEAVFVDTSEIISPEKLEELRIKRDNKEANKTALAAARQQKAESKALEKLAGWKEGIEDTDAVNILPKVYLRVKDKEIQTSKGARVSIPRAKEVYYKWLECLTCIEGEVINGYEVTEATKEHIIIGCHHIEKDEIFGIALLLKW